MQSFDVVSDSTIYISQLGAFENHVPGRTRSHEVYVFEVRPGCDTMPPHDAPLLPGTAPTSPSRSAAAPATSGSTAMPRASEGEYWQSCTVSRVSVPCRLVLRPRRRRDFLFRRRVFQPAAGRRSGARPALDLLPQGGRNARLPPLPPLGGVGAARHDAPRRADVGRRTVGRVRAYRRAGDPLSGFAAAHTGRRLLMPHGEDTARDFCSYPFQGFDVDGRCCYLFEGAGNGNKPANGPSDARITVTTLDGGIVHWRLPVGAYSRSRRTSCAGADRYGICRGRGIKRKGDRLWLGVATRRSADAVRRANLLRH